jgi:aspartyl-tRNA synthetase
MINYVKRIPNESVVQVTGEVVTPEQEVKSCTQDVELMVSEVWVLDKADFRLPIQIHDASQAKPQGDSGSETANVCA